MKNIFSSLLLIFCLVSCKSFINQDKSFKITDKSKFINSNLTRKFLQKDVKVPKDFTLPEPENKSSLNFPTKAQHISNISAEEIALIKKIEEIK